MAQNAVRSVLIVAGFALGFAVFGTGATASGAATPKAGDTSRCLAATTKQSAVTNSDVAACVGSSLTVLHPCPSGSKAVFVVSDDTTYALRPGARPIRLAKHSGLVALNQACGPATPSSNAQVTTTVQPPPPMTTPLSRPTTAVAAACTPLSENGTCYESGEQCGDDDHGVIGIGAHLETITCEDDGGWRWESS